MSDTCSTHTKPNGDPCAAHPLPNSDFCLFHDPAHAAALAEARRKGGSSPRRRTRRFPRLLDHVHVAELLGELFIEALNQTDVSDTKRLQTLTHLSRVLLTAVGTPPTFLIHSDRREPAPAAGHLLRIYPPVTPEVEALLEVEPNPQPPTPEPLNAPTPEPLNAESPDPALPRARMPEVRSDHASLPGDPSLEIGDYDAWWGAVYFCHPDHAPALSPEPLNTRTPEPLTPEQGPDRAGTGLPATELPPTSDPSDPSDRSPSVLLSRLTPVTASAAAPAGEGTHGRAASVGDTPAVPTSLEPLNTRTPEPLNMEQALNRARTGPRSTEQYWDLLLAALPTLPPSPAAPPANGPQDAPSHDLSSDGVSLAAATDAVACPEHLNTEHLNT